MKIAPQTALDVSLHWDEGDIQPVGRLAWRNPMAYFEFDDGFLKTGLELSPVHDKAVAGLLRPYDGAVFAGLHGLFNDSLPDGWGRLLVDRRARQLGINPATLTPLDRLACVGSSGIGALCYAPATDIWDDNRQEVDLDSLARDARRVLRGDVGALLLELGRAGGSPGGARPKALIAIDDAGQAIHGSQDVPDGYSHYLVKFPGPDDPDDIAAVEMAYAQMAHAAGVIMPECRLLRGEGGTSYFAARRFDRDGRRRLHVQSAGGLLYTDIRIPALDYQDLILLTRHVTRDQRHCRAMFTLAVFNILAHNRDDHARQFSFIMGRDGVWHLAPAYDLTFSNGPGGEHSTSVLGHGRDITRAHVTALGKKAEMNADEIAQTTDQVEAAIGDWQNFAKQYDVSAASRNSIAAAMKAVRL